MTFKIGYKVVKNTANWIVNDFDRWGRGEGVGIIVEPPFFMEEWEVDVRWPHGRCFENTDQLLPVPPSDEDERKIKPCTEHR